MKDYAHWEGESKQLTVKISSKTHAMVKKFCVDNGMSMAWVAALLIEMNANESLPGIRKMLEEGVIPASRERFILDEFYGLYRRGYRVKPPSDEKPRLKESKKGRTRTRGRGRLETPQEYKDNRWRKDEE